MSEFFTVYKNGKLSELIDADEFLRAENLKVDGSLDLRGSGITELPDNLSVGMKIFI